MAADQRLPDSAVRELLAGVRTVVAVGTHEVRFHRLEELVGRAAGAGVLPAPVLVQTGQPEVVAEPAPVVRKLGYLPPEMLEEAFRAAEVVVTHAGPGLLFLARRCGHVPVVVARLASFGEAVDDHQVAFAASAAEEGYCSVVTDLADLRDVLASRGGTTRSPATSTASHPAAVERLEAAVAAAVAERRRRRQHRRHRP